ncbi:MAG: hypothetical protein JO263_01265 [Candidatus Eremiobacteraeota bacterium]|nr:hypothetical protein [Candidatus Eremiobacteraeota bacterium]
MPLFPPGIPVAVIVDGRPLTAYQRATLVAGRVYVPVAPLLTGLADSISMRGNTLVVQRGVHQIQIAALPISPSDLDTMYVPAGNVLRALGVALRYEPKTHRLFIQTDARVMVGTPTPFNPAAPTLAPSAVFTPLPLATPRPVWTGSPLPRRTALPLPPILRR